MEDSKSATLEHISNVNRIGAKFVVALKNRLIVHDKSKLRQPEKKYLDLHTVSLYGSTYMSDEYKKTLQEMSPGLKHHYSHNDHHPQFFKQWVCATCLGKYIGPELPDTCSCGDNRFTVLPDIFQMSILAITEMLIDWCAAVERHADGDILTSIEKNQKRFGYGDELKQILINTVKEMGCA